MPASQAGRRGFESHLPLHVFIYLQGFQACKKPTFRGNGAKASSELVDSLIAYSGDVNGRFQRDVNGHSGHVNKGGAQRRWDYNHARHLRD